MNYVWRAVGDDQTCEECQNMDGRTVSDDEVKRGLCPPLHEQPTRCRCVLEPQRNTEFVTNKGDRTWQ